MKVLAINGSPHKSGTTAAAIAAVAARLEKQGIEVETMQVGHLPIHGCMGCGSCMKNPEHHCVFDDAVNVCHDKCAEIDGLIIASPVYYGAIAGTMKCFLDRLFYTGPDLKFKVGLALAAVRRTGEMSTFQQLTSYLSLSQMIMPPSQYWVSVHGMNAEEIKKDEEGYQVLEAAGDAMAWLMKMREATKDTVPAPDIPLRTRTNFVR